MKAEYIIDSLNKFIRDKRKELSISSSGHLVLHKTIDTHNSFKAFKTYKYKVWFVSNKKKYLIIEVGAVGKVIDGNDTELLKDINEQLCISIYKNIYSGIIKDIIDGSYDKPRNE